jgi:hypothetical protein
MKPKQKLLLNFKINSHVRKRNKLKAISPWKKVDIEIMDNIIKKLENQLKDESNA